MDSVPSIAQKREGPFTSIGIDQWSMLGHDDIKEEIDELGHGKGEDKGRLSPWRVVQLGVASWTSFIRVPPPLSPHRGSVALGPVSAVGGTSGHMKLELLAKFTRKGFPIV